MLLYFNRVNYVERGVYFSVGSDDAVYRAFGQDPNMYHLNGILFDERISGIIKEPLETLVNDLVNEGTFSGFDRLLVTSRILGGAMKDIIDNITADLLLDHVQSRLYRHDVDSEIDLDIQIIVTECLWDPSDLLFEFDISIGLDEQIDSFSNLKKLSVTSRILGEL